MHARHAQLKDGPWNRSQTGHGVRLVVPAILGPRITSMCVCVYLVLRTEPED